MSSSTSLVSNSSSKTLKSKIEKIVFGGAGLFRDQGCVVFVPFAAPNDELEVRVTQAKKDYKIAKIEKILKAGPDRIKPSCPYYTHCGGCQLQHLKPQAQLKIKQGFLEEAFDETPPVIASSRNWHYRSHLRLNLDKGTFGFKARDKKTLIEINECSLFLPAESHFFQILRSCLVDLKTKGSFRVFKAPASKFVLAFSFPRKLPKNRRTLSERLMQKLPIQGIAMKCPNGEEHFGNIQITESICGLDLTFSPYGFMQNNLFLIPKLYQTLVMWANPTGKSILDLYSGVGTSSLLLAREGGSVIAIEESRAAVKCAQKNQKRNHIQNVSFVQGRVEGALKNSKAVDLVVVNPPRTGLSQEVLEAFNTLKPQEIVYVSCMPSTLKRDLIRLKDYEKHQLEGFDLFPQTTHLETMVKMVRKNLK